MWAGRRLAIRVCIRARLQAEVASVRENSNPMCIDGTHVRQSTSEQPTPPKRGRGRPRKLVMQDPSSATTPSPVGTPIANPTLASQDVRFALPKTTAAAPRSRHTLRIKRPTRASPRMHGI